MSIVNMFNSAARLASNAGSAALGAVKAHPLSMTLVLSTAAVAGVTFNRLRQQAAATLFIKGADVKEGETRKPVVGDALGSLQAIQRALMSSELDTNTKLLEALKVLEKDAKVAKTDTQPEKAATSHYDLPAAVSGVTKDFSAARTNLIGEIEAELAKQDLPALKTALKGAVEAQMKLYEAADDNEGRKGAKVTVKAQFAEILKAIDEAKDLKELTGLTQDIKKTVLTQNGSNAELNEPLKKFSAVKTDDFKMAFEQNEEAKKGIEAQLAAALKLDTEKKDVAPVLVELAKILDGKSAGVDPVKEPAVKPTFQAFADEQTALIDEKAVAKNKYFYAAAGALAFLTLVVASASRIPALQNAIQKLPTSIRPLIA